MNSRQLLWSQPWQARLRAGVAAALFTALCSVLVVSGNAAPAHAAGRVDVSPAPSADGETTVTLTGSGFQYLPNAPGGIYVSFGVVADPTTNSWAPSQGGKSGSTFGYAATGGTTILVSFAGGSSAEAANALIEADGTWTAQMRIPGSTFPSISGNPHAGEATEGATIDCLKVQCGIITFGAHGMINSNNESFTPVSFMTAAGTLESGTSGQTFTEVAPGNAATAPGEVPADEATQLEIPGAGGGATAAKPEAAPSAAPVQDGSAPAAQQPATEQPEAGLSSSGLVIGVLAFAVAALLAAVVFALARKARAARATAAGAGSEAARAETAGEVPVAESSSPVLAAFSGEAESRFEEVLRQPDLNTHETQVNAAAEAAQHREGAR